ncbi:MAG: queuosine salvage family protein [Candidatus Acidiferrales bacterium]
MNTSRRAFVRGISAFSAAAAAASELLRSASAAPVEAIGAREADSIGTRWRNLAGSPVLDSLRPVIEHSRDVYTHVDKIVAVAQWMTYEDLPMPELSVPYGLAKDPIVAMDFIMVTTTIDSAFTDFKTHVKFQVDYEGQIRSDSDGMLACLKRAMDNGIPILDGKFLAALTRPQMEKIFAGNIEMPMLDEKLQNFRDVGKVLAGRYDGYFHNFIQSCPPKLYDNGKGLVDRLVTEFPRFNDVSQYDGHEIKFYKLAQLGYWGIYSGLHSTNTLPLVDIGKMTAFADYIIPVGLQLLGIISYSPALEHAIHSYQLIPRDSAQEIEIRAHSLYATALLAEEINKIRPANLQIIIPQIDARLWSHYHTTFWPHHLTKTIMY